MRAYNGFEAKRSVGASEPLPAGGYVAKIMSAKVEEYSWGEVLVISFDIAEGEHKDFFAKQYRENTREDKKWKGNFRLNVPDERNQWFESQKRTFGNAIACVEESNRGYKWDWNEANLKGKMVGVLFRNFEWEMEDGRTGWSTECCTFVSVDEIRNNDFKMPKDRNLKKKANNNGYTPVNYAPTGGVFAELDDSMDDLPF